MPTGAAHFCGTSTRIVYPRIDASTCKKVGCPATKLACHNIVLRHGIQLPASCGLYKDEARKHLVDYARMRQGRVL
eukprot:1162153-Pelagomonas_calceolata.AAC.11